MMEVMEVLSCEISGFRQSVTRCCWYRNFDGLDHDSSANKIVSFSLAPGAEAGPRDHFLTTEAFG
jgi:hypothetical protein